MIKYQLWSRDEYGQQSILDTSEDLDAIVTEAKRRVSDANVNNALTSTDRENNWEMYFLFLTSTAKKAEKQWRVIYGGKGPLNRDIIYVVDKKTSEVFTADKTITDSIAAQVYLGNISADRKKEVDWFAVDTHHRPIIQMNHPDLASKTMLFVKAIKQ